MARRVLACLPPPVFAPCYTRAYLSCLPTAQSLAPPLPAVYEQQQSLSAQPSTSSLDASTAFAAAAGAAMGGGGGPAAPLPPSGIYASSCRAFTWPLLAPQSQEEPGPPHATWLLSPDDSKVELRRQHVRAPPARSCLPACLPAALDAASPRSLPHPGLHVCKLACSAQSTHTPVSSRLRCCAEARAAAAHTHCGADEQGPPEGSRHNRQHRCLPALPAVCCLLHICPSAFPLTVLTCTPAECLAQPQ